VGLEGIDPNEGSLFEGIVQKEMEAYIIWPRYARSRLFLFGVIRGRVLLGFSGPAKHIGLLD